MKTHRLFLPLLCAVLPMIQGCSSDDAPNALSDGKTLTFCVGVVSNAPAISRANSLTHEAGIYNESDISNIVVVIYTKPINDNSGDIVKKYYITDATYSASLKDGSYNLGYYASDGAEKTTAESGAAIEKGYTKTYNDIPASDFSKGATYYAMAFANTGDLNISSKNDIRNLVRNSGFYTSAASISDYTDFVMGPADEVKFTYTENATGAAQIPVLMVQRLAARVDVQFAEATYDDTNKTVTFPIYDGNKYEAGQDVKISGAAFTLNKIELTNCVTKNAYLVERSHVNASGAQTFYLAREGWNSNGFVTRFIESPDSKTTDMGTITYSGEAVYNVLKNPVSGKQYSVLGYVGENTYTTVSTDNKETSIALSGTANISAHHFDGTGTASSTIGLATSAMPIRHSYGNDKTDAFYNYAATVRNTIYRLNIKFYAYGDQIAAKWYYYNADGSEVAYDANIYSFILESSGTGTPND